MPLRVQLDGNSINAALLSETQWQALKGSRSLRMPCCDALAYRRTSQLGTRHFAHSPRSHCGAEGECAEHLAAKAEIVRVCNELGWDAISEYVGDQWRADVYAMRGRHRLAFEIQWSTQTLQVTRERHAAYGTDIKCCWLFKQLPLLNRRESGPYAQHTIAERNLPMFCLSHADSRFDVTVDQRTMSLQEFVRARLQGRIHFCDQRTFVVREVQFVVSNVQCWRRHCRAPYDVFYTREIMRSNCGAERMTTDPGERESLDDDPYSALRNWRLAKRVSASEEKQLRLSIKRRWSDTVRRSYWSFGCPECDAIYGDHYFSHLIAEAESDGCAPFCSKELRCSQRWAEPHWCFPVKGGFCS
jgi:hypothetical protein